MAFFSVGSLVAYLTVDGATAASAQITDVQRSLDLTGTAAERMGAKTDAGMSAASAGTSKLTVAQLRATAASERYNALLEAGGASTARLASSEASLISANLRVAESTRAMNMSLAETAAVTDGALTAGMRRAGEETTRLGGGFLGLLRTVVPIQNDFALAGVAIAAVGALSLKAASDYQKLTVNLVTGAGEQQSNLAMVSKGMLSMAGQVGDSAQDLAKAMFTVESAGYHGAAGLAVLRTAAEGAKVDNADLTTVVDALTSAMNAYHLPVEKAAQVTNTLIASAAVGKMHLQDLADSLGTVLPSAAALRVPLDQVGAAMATMTMQGTDSARAATYLRFAFAALANPTAKAQGAMAAVGLTSEKVANTMTHGGLPAVFELLQTAVGEKFPEGSAKYLAALANMVGGTRGLQAVLELTGSNLTTMDSNLTSIDGRVSAAGNSVSEWSDVQKNFNVQLSQFVDGLEAAGIGIGEKLIPVATDLVRILNTLVHGTEDVVGFFDHNEAAAIALAAVLSARLVPALVETGVSLGAVAVEGIVGMFTSLSAAVTLTAAAFAESDGAIAGFGLALDTLDINPVVATVGALTAAVAGAALVFGHVSDNYNEVASSGDKYVASLHDQHTSSVTSTQDVADMVDKLRDLKATHTDNMAAAEVLKAKIEQLSAAIAEEGGVAGTERTNVAALAAQYGMTTKQVIALAEAHHIVLSGALADVASKFGDVAPKSAQVNSDFVNLGKTVESLSDRLGDLDDAWNRLVGNFLGMKVAEAEARGSIDEFAAALKKSKGSLNENTAAGQAAIEALGNVGTKLDGVAQSVYTQTGSYDKTSQAMKSMVAYLTAILPKGSAITKQVTAQMAKYLAHVASLSPGYGKDFGDGYASGIISTKDKVAAAASDLALVASAAIPPTQKSKSPSKVTYKFGQDFGTGYSQGILSTLPEIVGVANRMVAAAISAATTPSSSDPSVLAGLLGSGESSAISARVFAEGQRTEYESLKQTAAGLSATAKAADTAASKAKKLADAAKDGTAIEKAHKAALDESAHALQQQANVADRAAKQATNAAAAGKSAWDKAKSAADTAAQAAATAAQSLVSSLQSALDQMSSAITDFDSSIASGLVGDDSFSSLWSTLGQNFDAAQQGALDASTAVQSAQDDLTKAQNAVAGSKAPTADELDAVTQATLALAAAQEQQAQAQQTLAATPPPSAMSLQNNLSQVLASAQQFAGDLKTLSGEGASSALIQQLVGMGPQAGDMLASQLVAAGATSVGQLSSTLDQISSFAQSTATSFGQQFADSLTAPFFPGGVSAMGQFIAGLEQEFPALMSALAPLLNTIDGALGITPTSSVSGATGGVPPVLRLGQGGIAASAAFAAPAAVAMPASLRAVGGDGAVAPVINVTATLTDEDRALLRRVAGQMSDGVDAMESRPAVLSVGPNGEQIIGQIALKYRNKERAAGNPDAR